MGPTMGYKGVELLLTRPCYTLKGGFVNVHCEHYTKLHLCKFVLQQNWVDASGVFSVFFKASCWAKSP